MESSFYLSFLSDCVPHVLDLALKGYTGVVDVLNPAPLDDYDFREVCNRGNRPLGASIELVCSFEKIDFLKLISCNFSQIP